MLKFGTEPFLECSSKGDKRFSAFYAKFRWEDKDLPAFIIGKSIEEIYQSNKIFEDGSGDLSWKEAKGRTPTNVDEVRKLYSSLWDVYFRQNPDLLEEINKYEGFSDIFGQEGHACQAEEIFRISQEHKRKDSISKSP